MFNLVNFSPGLESVYQSLLYCCFIATMFQSYDVSVCHEVMCHLWMDMSSIDAVLGESLN